MWEAVYCVTGGKATDLLAKCRDSRIVFLINKLKFRVHENHGANVFGSCYRREHSGKNLGKFPIRHNRFNTFARGSRVGGIGYDNPIPMPEDRQAILKRFVPLLNTGIL